MLIASTYERMWPLSTSRSRDRTSSEGTGPNGADKARAGDDAPPPASGAYHHGDLRRALITAGRELLAEHGPTGVSLREVARAVGVSHNAPYRHFESREALLAAIATDGYDLLSRRMSATSGADQQKLVACGVAYVGFAVEFPSLYRLMFSSDIRKDAFPLLRAAADHAYAQLETAIPTGVSSPRVAALGAWAIVHGLADLLVGGQLSPDISLDTLITEAIEAYANGLSG